ncbi:MAG: mannose-1-phosphate guanylyltransferase/mannose-6-phosphate isomerase [Pseudomonadota bacterium]
MIIPVVLSGGSGSRLWPLSRKLYPKQLLPLMGENTMVQDTVMRLDGLDDLAGPMVVCNEAHRFLVAEQLRKISKGASAIILEPVGRNTAPTVAVAAMHALMSDEPEAGEAVMLVLPSDHAIADAGAFRAAVSTGFVQASKGHLVTFGIVPTCAHTGYGYLHVGDAIDDGASKVSRFVEKPDAYTAAGYLASGEYLWNSGMFMFKVSRYLEELEKFAPEMLAACRQAISESRVDLDFVRLGEEAFAACPANSIDYAVMEKTTDAVVVPLDAGWSDVGTFSALHEASGPDEAGNVAVGDVKQHKCKNSYLHSTGRMIAAVGLENHIVIETSDAVLVVPADKSEEVKDLVEELKKDERSEALMHREVFRPWGSYDSVDMGERYQVKRLSVKPGATLSLQMHHHRAEHWIVVKGTAQITRGEEVFLLSENQSTYIPLGTTHRIANPGTVPLDIIEVQSGSYLGEDDIVRFEDTYGRAGTNES